MCEYLTVTNYCGYKRLILLRIGPKAQILALSPMYYAQLHTLESVDPVPFPHTNSTRKLIAEKPVTLRYMSDGVGV